MLESFQPHKSIPPTQAPKGKNYAILTLVQFYPCPIPMEGAF
jgi:hypothetical protein